MKAKLLRSGGYSPKDTVLHFPIIVEGCSIDGSLILVPHAELVRVGILADNIRDDGKGWGFWTGKEAEIIDE